MLKNFTLYDLKLVAVFLMVVDHLGIVFELTPLRWIGRFAFPLFGYFLINGFIYTSSFKNYYSRLLIFALVTQVFHSIFLYLNQIEQKLNILFLFICVLPILYYYKRRDWLLFIVFTVIALVLSPYLSYGVYGIALLFTIYLFTEIDFIEAFICWFSVNVYSYLFTGGYQYIVVPLPFLFTFFVHLPLGCKARWFYWFYPLHFIPLSLLKYVTSL